MRLRPIVVLNLLATCTVGAIGGDSRAVGAESLRVMTFNIWVGGEGGGQPLDETIEVIREARVDVVGIQEGCGKERNGKRPDNAKRIAERLGWHYYSQGDDDTSIMSRYAIVGSTPRKWAAQIELPSGRRVWVFNAHFAHAPYQPYQLVGIPYENGRFVKRAEEAVLEAQIARRHQVRSMLQEIAAVRDADTVIFVTGDFNEPSSLDWTDAVVRAGRKPAAVPWPTTAAVYGDGFRDAFREVYTDPLTEPGYTWTPTTSESDPKDHHDRIDFVLVGGPARVMKAEIVGESAEKADIVVAPYPSDHRGVVATVTIE